MLSILGIILGIDVSKDSLSCTLWDATTRQPQWHKEVKNTAVGYRQLLRNTAPQCVWILEPTGRYSQAVARAAREAGRGAPFGSDSLGTWHRPRKRKCSCVVCKAAPRQTNWMPKDWRSMACRVIWRLIP